VKLSKLVRIPDRINRLMHSLAAVRLSILRNMDGQEGERLRYVYYRSRLKKMGKNVRIDTGVFLYGPEYISIGDNTHIDKNCMVVGSPVNLDLSRRLLKRRELVATTITQGEVSIGRDCHISQNCMIYGYGGVSIADRCVMSAGSKIYSLTSMATNPFDESEVLSIVPYDGPSPTLIGKVVLNENVWIGLDSVISPGVEIGKNSFVRSKSIVLRSFKENSYIGGDPALFIRNRFTRKETQ
jgi:acetyltransferase-like isoleucine patch superfamily enzyme